jgi:hypothetical protein
VNDEQQSALTEDEWTAVLKLSTQWRFINLRKLAIRHISSTEKDPIDRICLGKEYGVYDWVLEGYTQVIERLVSFDYMEHESPTTLDAQESERIGVETALKLSGIAIRRLRWCAPRPHMQDIEDDVVEAFETELNAIQSDEARYASRSQCSG